MQRATPRHPGPCPLPSIRPTASLPARAGLGFLTAAGLLAISSCTSHRAPGAQWSRAEVRSHDWTPLHGAAGALSVKLGDGDYACCSARLQACTAGQIEVLDPVAAAEASMIAGDLAYLASARRNGQTGSTARSFCSVMQSFGQLIGAN